jgi:hypothetical protein
MPSPRARDDAGLLTIQYALAVGLSLVFLAQITNLLVFAYGRGAVRAALDEGVRAAAVIDAGEVECLRRAQAVLADLLGGDLGRGVGPIVCADDGARIRAEVTSAFDGWLPGAPGFTFTTVAQAVREVAP